MWKHESNMIYDPSIIINANISLILTKLVFFTNVIEFRKCMQHERGKGINHYPVSKSKNYASIDLSVNVRVYSKLVN